MNYRHKDIIAMASVGENLDSTLSSDGPNSPKPAIMESQGATEIPHLKVLVGGGLRVSVRTSGAPTPSCITDGGLRSHSTKLLLDVSGTEHSSPVKKHGSARLARSTSHLVSERHHTLPSSGVLTYVHSPTHLATYVEKKALNVSGISWSPKTSAKHHTKSELKTSSQGNKDKLCGCVNQGSKRHLLTKRDPHQRSFSFNCGRGEATSTLLSREQALPTCRRRVLTDYERNLTFKPKLNNYSLKIASRNARYSLPLVNRLSEIRKNQLPHYDQEHLTFVPKLNPISLKLAHERASKMPEVQARQAQQTAARLAEAHSDCTFKPRVSERSQRIVQGLRTDFLTRQQRHLAKKEKTLETTLNKSPTCPSPSQSPSKRPIKLKLKPRTLPLASQPSPYEADSAKAASCNTSSRRSSLSNSSRASCGEEGVANNENTPTTDDIRPASCTPTKRYERKIRQEMRSPNPKTPPQIGKSSRSKRTHIRINSAGGGKEGSGSLLKKMTGAVGNQLKKARFESLSDMDRVRRVKMNSEKIMKSKKVFLLRGGCRRIRKCLRKRGWVELDYYKNSIKSTNEGGTTSPKKAVEITRPSGGSSDDDSDGDTDVNDGGAVSEEEYSDEEEYCMLSRAVRNSVPNLVWTIKCDHVLFRGLMKDSMVNHFAKASSFTTKVGLCTNLRNLLWFGDTDPDTFFPRCYRLSCDEEKATFIEDYRFTAALCILKTLSQHSSNPHPCVGNSLPKALYTVASSEAAPPVDGDTETKAIPPEVPEEATQLAMKAAEAFLGSVDHNDIEGSQYQLCPKLTDSEWEILIHHFYSLAFENGQLRSSVYMCYKASDLLDEVAQHYPQLHMDGARNVWIIKPGASSRGRGIMCMDRLEPILELVSSTVVKKEGKWVIQKYIERPLLLFDTKFDIRQWFLVTDWNPLTMWMYKECYLRFSTQKYTLENLDQSIHLCNNSIQKFYSNDELRADALPRDNMWDSDTFQEYLSANGHPNLWENTIYPGMKQALIHVLQVTQGEIEHRKNSFELYGADFMLSSDYHPWLIEINCSPSMESSTLVTARLCRQVLEDTLKVVLDRREDKDCDIGAFELAYKQPRHEVPSYVGVQLCVQGYALPKPRSYSYIRKTVSNMSDSENVVADSIPTSNSSPVQQVSSDSKAKIISERNVTNQTSRKEISDSCVHSSNSKPTNSSSSTPSIQSSVATPTSPFRIGQTCFSCGTDFNQSRPGTSVNIVEINCKLPNTNLRVS